jgi:hypothetical protein
MSTEKAIRRRPYDRNYMKQNTESVCAYGRGEINGHIFYKTLNDMMIIGTTSFANSVSKRSFSITEFDWLRATQK